MRTYVKVILELWRSGRLFGFSVFVVGFVSTLEHQHLLLEICEALSGISSISRRYRI